MVCFVAGGSYVLSQFTKGTVEARDIKTKSRSVKAFALSEEHAKIERKLHGAEGPSASELILKRIPRKLRAAAICAWMRGSTALPSMRSAPETIPAQCSQRCSPPSGA